MRSDYGTAPMRHQYRLCNGNEPCRFTAAETPTIEVYPTCYRPMSSETIAVAAPAATLTLSLPISVNARFPRIER